MLTDFSPLLITLFAFGAVAAAVFVIGQFIAVHVRVQKRMAIPGRGARAAATSGLGSSFDWLVSTYFDEKRFGLVGSVRTKLRRELVLAGFFRADAINYYIFARMAVAVILPTAAYLLTEQLLPGAEWYLKLAVVAVAIMLGVLGPDAYIARRQRKLQQGFRIVFPDMLDLIVVCVDAGLSLESALDRISGQIAREDSHLGMNLALMGAEMRAGRSTIDALGSLADRVGIIEARSLVAMLRQSIELGTDVGDALRVYSNEMRDRRLLRAEERANQLPVKMVGPLGLFIFPVILGIVLLPVVIRLFTALSTM
jgi:tight adherence protein C